MSEPDDAAYRSGEVLFSFRRTGAIILRHWYVLRGSVPRILELAYWPAVQMLTWGFMTEFLVRQTTYVAQAFGILLAAVLLWDVLFRSQLGVSISFLEEVWARNLGHLFISPLRPLEMVAALIAMSGLRTIIGVLPAVVMAALFFGFNLASLGLPLVAFLILLGAMGWAVGLAISGLIMRYGQSVETLAWALTFALAPVSGIYYPVSILPAWLQPLSWALPSSYVFEGMREILRDHRVPYGLMWQGGLLDVLYLVAGILAFLGFFRAARERGLLLKTGE